MNCPNCDGKTFVKDCVKSKSEDYRKRVCESCGYSFFTVEFETENNESFERKWRKNHRRYKKEMQA